MNGKYVEDLNKEFYLFSISVNILHLFVRQ